MEDREREMCVSVYLCEAAKVSIEQMERKGSKGESVKRTSGQGDKRNIVSQSSRHLVQSGRGASLA